MSLVLIPAYEPDDRLVALVTSLLPQYPVLVVDDGSGHDYAAVFSECARAGARVVHHTHNRGKGAALRTGFSIAERDLAGEDVVTADADGQHTPADIARVAEALEAARPAPALVAAGAASAGSGSVAGSGSRAGSGTAVASPVSFASPAPAAPAIVLGVRSFTGPVPLRSRAGNAFTRRVFCLATGRNVRDTQTGLRGFPARVLPWLRSLPGDRFEYEFRMLLAAPGAGIDLVEVPISTIYLDENSSSHFRPLADSARIYAPLLRFSASALLAFLVDTVLLVVLQAVTGWLLLSIVLARVASSGMNFAINRGLVFGAGREVPLRTAAARYFSLAALLLTASFGMLTALTDAGFATLPAKIVTDLTLFAVSFSVQRAVVFAPVPTTLRSRTHARE